MQEDVILADNLQQCNPRWRQVRGQWALAASRLLQARDDFRELNTIMFYDPLTVADAELSAETAMRA